MAIKSSLTKDYNALVGMLRAQVRLEDTESTGHSFP